ncbi:hypothetical protein FQA39_LY13413 [Lamprigera yunnana]|nr:hypothetical protein FQA39_LY13413 [Lamprigera yunnana]
MASKVAVVTGGNKGVGFGIVKGLCENFSGEVYLTARDENRGNEAVKKLLDLGLKALFHQLDIDDKESIKQFANYIKEKEGGIDVLVNNAAIAFKNNATEPTGIQAKVTIATNYFGTLQVCEELFPLLRPNAQVVNMSSVLGHLAYIPSSTLRSKFSTPDLTIPQLSQLMNDYIKYVQFLMKKVEELYFSDAKIGKNVENGWGESSYMISKVGLSALTNIQQREFDKEELNKNISVNSVHPGYVVTDMTSHRGVLTVEEGAKAPVFLALGKHEFKGKYIWSDCSNVDWFSSEKPESWLGIWSLESLLNYRLSYSSGSNFKHFYDNVIRAVAEMLEDMKTNIYNILNQLSEKSHNNTIKDYNNLDTSSSDEQEFKAAEQSGENSESTEEESERQRLCEDEALSNMALKVVNFFKKNGNSTGVLAVPSDWIFQSASKEYFCWYPKNEKLDPTAAKNKNAVDPNTFSLFRIQIVNENITYDMCISIYYYKL